MSAAQINEGDANGSIDITIDATPPLLAPNQRTQNSESSNENQPAVTPTKNNIRQKKDRKLQHENDKKKLERYVNLDFMGQALEPQLTVLQSKLKLLAIDYLLNTNKITQKQATINNMKKTPTTGRNPPKTTSSF